ncbi:hypothetical protein MNKW57_22550 [Biformimicrobium ophioploci]|uniref:Alpha/beta hydrolase n=2 Tax=Biformimicrobium ophioploci TaxID=3036711 RepID=A0ABQ6M0V5_9GAMM|nr:hypothetical protein MNKW57_22550 [Microbulbifer sp. NKW57]
MRRSAAARRLKLALAIASCTAAITACSPAPEADCPEAAAGACLDSLNDISIEQLRARTYGTHMQLLERAEAEDSDGSFDTLLAGYDSDGLNVYTRIDVPRGEAPEGGYPVVVFGHGWVGIDKAPDYHLGLKSGYFYGELVQHFASRGYVVLTPGYRGHGTVAGKPADGIEFMQAWDNGSYLAPSFYAIDLVNLLQGVDKLPALNWDTFGIEPPSVNTDRIALVAHSQGGDAALTALAITGDNPNTPRSFSHASIWAGNIADKFTQANFFGPMGKTAQAFLSGDGSWTGTATSTSGATNPDFVFGYPQDWIATPHPAEWTWQKDSFPIESVELALQQKYEEMYRAIDRYALDISAPTFAVARSESGTLTVQNDPRVENALEKISAYRDTRHLHTPLALHFSDRDYYSPPAWNHDLQQRLSQQGVTSYAFEYPGTNHSLKISEHRWYSPEGTVAGFPCALARDLAFFSGEKPDTIHCDTTAQAQDKD